jgi:hypothetical protein
MSTKSFKIGEYSSYPTIKLKADPTRVEVQLFGWEGRLEEVRHYGYQTLVNFELDMCDITTSYYTSTMIEWIKGTKEYEAPKQDPFTTYTFSN